MHCRHIETNIHTYEYLHLKYDLVLMPWQTIMINYARGCANLEELYIVRTVTLDLYNNNDNDNDDDDDDDDDVCRCDLE